MNAIILRRHQFVLFSHRDAGPGLHGGVTAGRTLPGLVDWLGQPVPDVLAHPNLHPVEKQHTQNKKQTL